MDARLEKIKTHFAKYKHVYGYSACGVAITVLGVAVLRKQPPSVIINTVSPVFNNAASTLGGHLRKIVYSPDFDRYFGSVTEAARFAEVTTPVMSKHLNGHTDHVRGMTFKIVAVAN
jgi:hypothetical protein